MNVPGIRAALERMAAIPNAGIPQDPLYSAVVKVGLRAMHDGCNGVLCERCDSNEPVLRVIADILREAGVEVEG